MDKLWYIQVIEYNTVVKINNLALCLSTLIKLKTSIEFKKQILG